MEKPLKYRLVGHGDKWDVVSIKSGRRVARDKNFIDASWICSQKNSPPYKPTKEDLYWENYE